MLSLRDQLVLEGLLVWLRRLVVVHAALVVAVVASIVASEVP